MTFQKFKLRRGDGFVNKDSDFVIYLVSFRDKVERRWEMGLQLVTDDLSPDLCIGIIE